MIQHSLRGRWSVLFKIMIGVCVASERPGCVQYLEES